ncbi:MAG: hypothetical protein H0V46_06495 [Sphingomonas sp.]|nr:hypothetical protein [Sphingomonas sp.]
MTPVEVGRRPIILKRITSRLAAQDWNGIAIEFLIVTAGVLMGIQVSNWNDSRIEKARVHQQLSSLHTELQGNLATIDRYQRRIASQLGDITEIGRTFERSESSGGAIDGKLMNVFRISSLILETSAYDEINETGSLRHVPPDIRSAMTEWQARKGALQRADQDALSYRISAVDHLTAVLAFEPMVRTFAPSFKPADAAPVRNDPARLASDAKVRNFLAMRYAIETQKLQFAKELEGATKTLLGRLGRNGAA